MEQQKNNVYINPNFPQCSHYQPQQQGPIPRVHLNPAFSTSSKKPNIHVNPNFYRQPNPSHTIPSACSPLETIQPQSQEDHTNKNPTPVSSTLISTSRYKFTRKFTKQPDATQSIAKYNNASTSALTYYQKTSNRYKLTRKNNDSLRVTELTVPQPNVVTKRTVALNKYKSVRLSDIRENIDTRTKPTVAKSTQGGISSSSNKTPFIKQYTHNKFKLTICKPTSFKTQLSPGTKKHMNSRFKFNKINKIADYNKNKLKKCNIPCPLYRKFGKCLRLDKGTSCTYIHDKKHVTICKKFIKGICFDKNCLLSHEISSKKMPTCAFYLRGLCAKENCPYSHVKLNDSTKICNDFINGFCEKGDTCSKKHVCTVIKRYPRARKLTNYHKKVQNIKTTDEDSGTVGGSCGVEDINKLENNACTSSDRRYFKDNAENEQVCEIKPTRAKLGTLPSFIKL